MNTLKASVGQNGTNDPDDVRAVQTHLNAWLAKTALALSPLTVSGLADGETQAAILNFQKRVGGMKTPDGRIDPGGTTWRLLSVWGSDRVASLSGADWWHANQARFPNSRSVDDLDAGFQACVRPFLAALKGAGASVSIDTTFRSLQRAYIMRYSWDLAKELIRPSAVPAMDGVDIIWDHGNLVASVRAAKEMAALFGLAFRPSLNTRHNKGLAIDMDIRWSGTMSIRDKAGKTALIGAPNNGAFNTALHRVGASYGLIKLLTDRPHWSDNGH